MTATAYPITEPPKRHHSPGPFEREEVRLANRNSGTLLEMLRHDVTPIGLHYLLIHFDVPYVASAADWTVKVGGRVQRPISVSLDEIKSWPAKTLRVTLECAGNGRATVEPRWPSQPWHHEAVGTAEWTGTPLRHLLEKAGLGEDVVDVVFYGTDRGFDSGVEHDYGRSLKPLHALSDDVMLVYAMNGQPLLPQHGFPLRLVVPGWYGMASVKWLDRIEAWDRPFDGYQQVRTYIYKRDEADPGVPATTLRVKSLMVPPGIPDFYSRARMVDAGSVELFGRAWSGAGVPIRRVEVGVDGQWHDAKLDAAPESPYAWRGWRWTWDARPGTRELACRATDANGETQPFEQRLDNAGFGNNMVHRLVVTVR
ncbi:MAG: sulfite oxidase [Hyphomicrobiaceae bacterium]